MKGRITHWHSVPSMIPYFLRDSEGPNGGSTCRLFTFCGEPLMRTDVEQLAVRYPNARIINTYGPTEATLFCSFYEYRSVDASVSGYSVPIGQPIPWWNFVLVPEDNAVRLIILSDSISEGYVGLSSSNLSTVKLFGREVRAFDTGDYFNIDGNNLHFSHRQDGMVKVNGVRIDLGEIEAAGKKAGLINPVALILQNSIALVTESTNFCAAEVMCQLAKYLPKPNMPSIVRFVDAHPRTVSGKLNRQAIRKALEDSYGG